MTCWTRRRSSMLGELAFRARTASGERRAAQHTKFRRAFHARSTERCHARALRWPFMVNRIAGAEAVRGLGREVGDLCEALGDLLTALVHIPEAPCGLAPNQDGNRCRRPIAWLRPLALASVKLEYVVRDWPLLNATTLAARCDDLARVLDASPFKPGDRLFSARYARERARSPTLAALHARVVEACRNITTRCSSTAKGDRDE